MKRLASFFVCLAISTNVVHACDDDDSDTFQVFGTFSVTQDDVFATVCDSFRVRADNHLTVEGGEITAGFNNGEPLFNNSDTIDLRATAQAIVSGGVLEAVDDGVKVKDNSLLTVSGGTIHGFDDGISVADDGRAHITGGAISGDILALHSIDRGRIQVSGGRVVGTSRVKDFSALTIQGGDLGAIEVKDYSSLKILGGEFRNTIEVDDDAVVASFHDPITGQLLDGNPALSHWQVRAHAYNRYTLTALRRDLVIDARTNRTLGILNDEDGNPTTVDLLAGAQIDELYTAQNSTANLIEGFVTHALIDDDAQLNMSGGRIQRSTTSLKLPGITAIGRGSFQMTDGIVNGGGNVGLKLRSHSNATIDGGTVQGGVEISSFATMNMSDGMIVRDRLQWTEFDDGVRLDDDAAFTMHGGTVIGADSGITLDDDSRLELLGGVVRGGQSAIQAQNAAEIDLLGGELDGNLSLRDRARLKMSAGIVDGDIVASFSSRVAISGGRVTDDIRLDRNARLEIQTGMIQGDIEIRDHARGEIFGGPIRGKIRADDSANVRIFGRNLNLSDGRLVGNLFDGSAIDSAVETAESATVTPYEALTERGDYQNRPGHIAVFGDGPVEHVDFRSNSEVTGDLLVLDDGRANILGGTIAGKLTALREGTIAFYGTNISVTPDIGVTHVLGTLADGTGFAYDVINEEQNGLQVTAYEVIRTSQSISITGNNHDVNYALMDGEDGPNNITLAGPTRSFSNYDVRDQTTFEIQGTNRGTEFLVRDRATVRFVGNANIHTFYDGVFARDVSRVFLQDESAVTSSRDGIRIWDDSQLEMTGGHISGRDDGIDTKHDGQATLTGGYIFGNNMGVKAKSRSTITIGGDVEIFAGESGIDISDDAVLTVSGSADIAGRDFYGIDADDDAVVEILGGQISGGTAALRTRDDAIINVLGGQFGNGFVAAGGTINVVGTDLALDNTRLTGILQDGTPLDVFAVTESGGQIVLSSVLERDCDFTGDGACNLADIDALLYEGLGTANADFDLDENGTVDLADRDEWFRSAERIPGDFDFDGVVDSIDLNRVGVNWTLEGQLSYQSGDTNGDGTIDAQDLNVVAVNWRAGTAQAVPEPTMAIWLWAVLGWYCCRRTGAKRQE